ncbi:MAG: WD40 repeat domain-containing protein [Bryobacteraceae bacterium]|nr:WD40 repeat domain-containing protein [Bryobacteraceae bacterium]
MPRLQATLTGGRHGYLCLAFSPDGKLLAGGNQDGSVTVWDPTTCTEVTTLRGHGSAVLTVAFSPNSQILASGSGDETVRLWDMATKQELATLGAHGAKVTSIAFTLDGKRLASATGSPRGTVRLWDVNTRQHQVVFQQKDSKLAKERVPNIYQVAFSPDGKVLAVAVKSGVILCDLETQTEKTIIPGMAATCVAFTPDGRALTIKDGAAIKLWDLAQAREQTRFDSESSSPVVSLAISPTGKLLAAGISAGPRKESLIKLWDLTTGKQVITFPCHRDGVWQVAFSADGKTLATAGEDRAVKLWSVAPLTRLEPGR